MSGDAGAVPAFLLPPDTVADVAFQRAATRSPIERFGPYVVLALSETALVVALHAIARDEWHRGALLMNVAAGLLLAGSLLRRRARASPSYFEAATRPPGQVLRFAGTVGFVLLVVGSYEIVAGLEGRGLDRWVGLIGGPFTLFLSVMFLTAFFIALGKPRD